MHVDAELCTHTTEARQEILVLLALLVQGDHLVLVFEGGPVMEEDRQHAKGVPGSTRIISG